MEQMNIYAEQFLGWLPNLLIAVVLLVLALLVASGIRTLVRKLIHGSGLDARFGKHGANSDTLSKPLGEISYFLTLLLFLPSILGYLGMENMLAPLNNMLDNVIGAIPNLIAAGIILFIGYTIAKVLRNVVTSVSEPLDEQALRLGMPEGSRVSNLLGLFVFITVLIPVITAALDALGLQSVAQPIQNMMNSVLANIPNLIGAGILLAVAWYLGRMVAKLLAGLMAGAGLDHLPAKMGLSSMKTQPSNVAEKLIVTIIMVLAASEAFRLLGLVGLAALMGEFIVVAGQVLVGLLVFAVGAYLANMFGNLAASSTDSKLLPAAARTVTLVLFGFMALGQMGIAGDIVNLAFGLLLGALALAFGLAFGLGGTGAAGKIAEDWRQKLERENNF